MSLNDSLASIRKIDINDLDLNNIGSWPAAAKVIAGILAVVLVLALGYNFHLKDLQLNLERLQSDEAVSYTHLTLPTTPYV